MEASAPIRNEADAVAWVLARTSSVNGDDAAVVRIGGGAACVSTDSTIEGVHVAADAAPQELGTRAAARALSDLAAMGAAPVGITCAVHVPPGRWQHAVDALAAVQARAEHQGAPLLGGDFTATPGPALALVVTALGRRAGGASGTGFVARAGASARDVLCVTGCIGARGLPEPPDRLRVGIALAPIARAMIDVTDGLAADSRTLAEASGCSVRLHLDAVPLDPDVNDPVQAAGWGDDYELLLALAPERLDDALAAVAHASPGLALTPIGQLTDASFEHEFLLRGARVEPGAGFVHE